jgi:hypothetical protein
MWIKEDTGYGSMTIGELRFQADLSERVEAFNATRCTEDEVEYYLNLQITESMGKQPSIKNERWLAVEMHKDGPDFAIYRTPEYGGKLLAKILNR